jgi:uroporphyrin-III C-methyltransferase
LAGKVYIVGAGPGDPELVTVKGLRLIREADAIVYDRLAPRELLAQARPGARLYYVGKRPGGMGAGQDRINELLASLALEGLKVVRLHGGDPLTYGRGEEECLYLKAKGVPCEVVPGVASYTAAAARAMAPLAGRGFSSSFAVTTAVRAGGRPLEGERLRMLASAADTLVVLMGAKRLGELAGELALLDPGMPVVVVESATTPRERILDLTVGEARGLEVEPPAVVIAGGAARWRRESWLGVGRSS